MPDITRRHVVAALGAGAMGSVLAGLPGQARAQANWPDHPVRIIVPYAPGAGTDFIVRAVAERLSRQTGQQFVVEHRGGAAGALGTESVIRSLPDGYTLLMTPQAPVQLLPHLRKLPYNPMTDLVTVGRMGESISGFAAHPSVGAKNLVEFIALAKKNPGKFTYATSGVGSVNHLRAEALKLMAGIDILHVPYKGVGEALPDLLAGNVSCMFDSNVFPYVKAGKLVLLGVLADERYSEFPDVGTMKEQGLPDYDIPIWYGAYAPAGVPQPILTKLHAELAKMHSDPEFQAKQFAGGIRIYQDAMTLPELKAWVAAQSVRFADLMQRAHITLDQ
ncbi:MAG: tripartite tricarboxylate transporter substrate binding protein [Acetobacteraceae bacterium]